MDYQWFRAPAQELSGEVMLSCFCISSSFKDAKYYSKYFLNIGFPCKKLYRMVVACQ